MRTYLELEDKLGAWHQLCMNIFCLTKNSLPRKTPVPKKAEKERRAKAPVKRKFKVRVIAQSMPTKLTLPASPTLSTEPTLIVATSMLTTQMPVARTAAATATAIHVTVYNLDQGKFKGIPYPTKRLQEEEVPPPPVVTTLFGAATQSCSPCHSPTEKEGLSKA